MSDHVNKLREKYETAEARAQKLMADKDEAMQKVRDRFTDRLRAATDEAAEAQREWRNAEAAQALVGRPDAALVADRLGLTLPDED